MAIRDVRKALDELQDMLLHHLSPDDLTFDENAILNLRDEPVNLQTVIAALETITLALGSSLGECRRATPFSPLRPVIDSKGNFKWCCNHTPEHCAS